MPSTINTNINSLTAQRNLGMSQSAQSTAIQRLSSGLRINSAKDDAAGLAITERFSSQIRGLNQAARNANDGISLAQVAEGAMGSASSMLQRIRELAVQSANATNSGSDRAALQQEVGQLSAELDRIAQTTQFNGQNLLDGTFGTQQYQVGANANQTIVASTANMRTSIYGNNQNAASAGAGLGAQAAATAATGNSIGAGTIGVSGYLGSGTVAVAANQSARVTAAQMNSISDSTGVTATPRTVVHLGGFSSTGAYILTLQGDNATPVSTSFTINSTTGTDRLSSVVAAINDQSARTNIVASLNTGGTEVVLTCASGSDIVVGDTTTANAAAVSVTGYDASGTATGTAQSLAANTTANFITTGGYVTLDSQKSFAITTTLTVSTASSQFTSGGSALRPVSGLDVTTFDNATEALKTVDSALAYISSERAKLGALQSRFESSISSLNITSENMSASRSRIQDADFASETASLSRAQILQQAGTAMVAQANQLPQGVLALLK